MTIEPAAVTLAATRAWLAPVRTALGAEFLAAYVHGSALTQGFDERRSRVNVLVVSRSLDLDVLDAIRAALPEDRKPPHVSPLFLTQRQIEKSLDVFPIEWIDIKERHLLIEGQDVLGGYEVPRGNLRLQLEQELREKLITLRQAYIAGARRPEALEDVLRAAASSFATLCRSLLRLRGESPPAQTAQVIERVADVFGLEAEGLLGAHLVRHGERRHKGAELRDHYRKFLVEVERLVNAIDEMRVP
ncbi:MAG: hypothetical protein ACRENJ_00545 [Candidatus Eiseniibacteriota bacterium]